MSTIFLSSKGQGQVQYISLKDNQFENRQESSGTLRIFPGNSRPRLQFLAFRGSLSILVDCHKIGGIPENISNKSYGLTPNKDIYFFLSNRTPNISHNTCVTYNTCKFRSLRLHEA